MISSGNPVMPIRVKKPSKNRQMVNPDEMPMTIRIV